MQLIKIIISKSIIAVITIKLSPIAMRPVDLLAFPFGLRIKAIELNPMWGCKTSLWSLMVGFRACGLTEEVELQVLSTASHALWGAEQEEPID